PRIGRPPRFLLFLVGLLVVFIVSRVLVSFIANWLWFDDLGFQRVFVLRLFGRLLLGVGAGLVALAFLRANMRLALRNRETGPRIVEVTPFGPLDAASLAHRVMRPLTWFVAIIVGLISSSSWLTVLRSMHPTSFGAADPVFGRDVSYYVFTLPVITAVI